MVENSTLLDSPEQPAPAPQEPKAEKAAMDPIPEVAEKPEEPAPEPEPQAVVAETAPEEKEALPAEPEAPVEIVRAENRASAGSPPPAINESLDDVRDDLLSKEQNVIQVPDFPVPGTTATPEPSGSNSSSDSVASASNTQSEASETPTPDSPVEPGTDPDTTPDTDPTDPTDDAPVVGSVREGRLVAALERGGGENSGLANALTRGSSQTDKTEPVEETETTAISLVSDESVTTNTLPEPEISTEQSTPTRPAPQQGRVVVGQSDLYSNALGGSVSGLIGGMDAPASTQRVQFRGGNAETGFQHSNGSRFAATPNVVNANITSPARGIPNNSAVSAAVSNGAAASGGNGSSPVISPSVPPGIANGLPSTSNGNAGPPTNFPGKAGFTPPGLSIRVNAGRR